MQDSNFREVRRLTDLLLIIERYERQKQKVVIHIEPGGPLTSGVKYSGARGGEAVAGEFHLRVFVAQRGQTPFDVFDLLVVLFERVGGERGGGPDAHQDDGNVRLGAGLPVGA